MHWYVLRSKHHHEDFLCRQLQFRNIEVYYPCIYKRKINAKTRKMKPYFPGYLFVHVDLKAIGISEVQWIPGALGLVSFGSEPARVSDGIIQTIRMHVAQLNSKTANELQTLKAGDDITIHSGPFAGYRGIFASYISDCERVIVFLKLLRDQQLRVELPAGQISSVKRILA